MGIPGVVAFVMVLALSGLPAGILLCGISCAPDGPRAPICHEHGGTADQGSAIAGVHLCDQDAAAVPMIVSAAFSLAAADVLASHAHPCLVTTALASVSGAWEFPPGPLLSRLGTSPSILRI